MQTSSAKAPMASRTLHPDSYDKQGAEDVKFQARDNLQTDFKHSPPPPNPIPFAGHYHQINAGSLKHNISVPQQVKGKVFLSSFSVLNSISKM
ncbi:hypothetical protein EWM64_g5212 [Hericium alpestre]|uniref:Uncharacterized protein n=1 Tax=Hericium alpestre TaxID=135208 RepID=A0A4Y9ZV73_9AGAM|nr:hypothetical protein EWM64_g5212 [Hericium alpestre]